VDNFETISTNEQTLCVEWIDQAPCSALITTRDKLDGARNVGIDAMAPDEAIEYFKRLIAQSSNSDAFTTLDRQLLIRAADANPLVMQWIVAQIELAQSAHEVLNDLKQGKGDAAQRVFDRSFNLPQLGDDGRAVLLALSLFVPSASRDALAMVAGFGNDIQRLNKAVSRLAALRLISTTDGGRRLMVTGLTRELANARLLESSSVKDFQSRFVQYFVEYTRSHAEINAENLDLLELEKDNLIATIDLAAETRDWEIVMEVTNGLSEGMLNLHGHWNDAKRVLNLALQAATNSNAQYEVASFGHNLAILHHMQGEIDEARRLYIKSLEIVKQLGDEQGIAHSLHQLGRIAQDQGKIDEARRLYTESFEIQKKLDNQRGIANSLHQLGRIAQDQGKIDEARRLYTESFEIQKKLDNQHGIANSLHQLGRVAEDQGKIDEARRLYTESLEITKKLGDQHGIANSFGQIGRLAESEHKLEEAVAMYRAALKIFETLGSPLTEMTRNYLQRAEAALSKEKSHRKKKKSK